MTILSRTAPSRACFAKEDLHDYRNHLWGARHPGQLAGIDEAFGWKLDKADMRLIDAILTEYIKDPVGPEFIAPLARQA